MTDEKPEILQQHPRYKEIVEQSQWIGTGAIPGKFNETDLLIAPEAAVPNEVRQAFDMLFDSIEGRAEDVRDKAHLDEIAEAFVTVRTVDDARVFNEELKYARIAGETRRTMRLRDIEITEGDLDNMIKALDRLREEVPIYKMYVRAGSGSEEHWFEVYFTPEGVKLALAAGIMMHSRFEKPKDKRITGKYFAMPEYQEVINPDNPGSVNPMRLSFLSNDEKAYSFVGATTYPGDVYKPFCEFLNELVHVHGGVEFHGSAVLVEYTDPITNEQVRKVVVISGLSLHGKSTLSSVQVEQLVKALGLELKDIPDLRARLFHDDYVAFKIHEVEEDGEVKRYVEVIVYAGDGIFPAVHVDPSRRPESLKDRQAVVDEDPILNNPETIFFNVALQGNDEDGWRIDPWGTFRFEDRYNLANDRDVRNMRACAPLDDETFNIDIVKPGLFELTALDYITLTKEPNTPSGLLWNLLEEALLYAAGLVVAPTDAEMIRAVGLKLNFLATVFESAARGPLLNRILTIFRKMQEMGIEVRGFTMNTGAPGVEESKAVLANMIMGTGRWEHQPQLGITYLQDAVGFDDDVYVPWLLEQVEMQQVIDEWMALAEKRLTHLETMHIDLGKSGLLQAINREAILLP